MLDPRLQPGTTAQGDISLLLGCWGRIHGWESPSPSSHTGSPQPLGLMLTRSCPPGAVLTLGWWLCQGHGSIPAHCLGFAGGPGTRVPLSPCCSQDGAPHLTCMAVAKPWAGAIPALWDLRYFISIYNLQRPRPAKQVFVRGWQLCVVDISRELVTTWLRCSPRALKRACSEIKTGLKNSHPESAGIQEFLLAVKGQHVLLVSSGEDDGGSQVLREGLEPGHVEGAGAATLPADGQCAAVAARGWVSQAPSLTLLSIQC